MKILQVVTYVSEDGAFGGPVAVAAAQAVELARQGHSVTLAAGWDGQIPFALAGVNVRLFRAHRLGKGLSGLLSPSLTAFVLRRAKDFDVVHVHCGRDLVSTLAATAARVRQSRTVLQTHGMIMPDGRAKARILDWLITRPVLKDARSILVLTAEEGQGINLVARRPLVSIERIANGLPSHLRESVRVPDRNHVPVVLFMARLHPRKRVLIFAQAASLILRRRPGPVDFRIVGPDEGDLSALNEYLALEGLESSIRYDGAVPPGQGLAVLRTADVYVLPSRGEVFPMSVIEAMAVGTPVVLTDDCGISEELSRRGAATVIDGSPESTADAIEKLLDDRRVRELQLTAAEEAIRTWLSIEAVAGQLVRAYTP